MKRRPWSKRRFGNGMIRFPRIAWGLVAVLLLQILGSSFGTAASTAANLSDSLNSGKIVVCTAAGLVILNRDGTPVEDKPVHAAEQCVFCTPFMHGAVASVVVDAVVSPTPSLPVDGVVPTGFSVVSLRLPLMGAASPHAPPTI